MYFTRFVLVDDRVVRQVPHGFATGIDLIIWNLSGMAFAMYSFRVLQYFSIRDKSF